jgi:hypothetical protein
MLQHADMHKGCLCYQKENKQTISLRKFHRGETAQSLLTSHHIIFVLDGAVTCTITGSPDATVVVRSDEFIFLPVSTNMVWEALEDTTVLLVRLDRMVGKLPECGTFRFQRLSGNLKVCQVENPGVYPLQMNERVRYFIRGVVATERDGLKCGNYAGHLVAQLLTLIQVYYPPEEYMRFYSTVASPDVAFTDRVYEKWMACRSVGELANAFGMNQDEF